jgi:Ser/Thr protein kinase RdoA (MazF antagonist)
MDLRRRFTACAVAVLNLTKNYLTEASADGRNNYPARVTEYAPGCSEQSIEQTAMIMSRKEQRA